MIRYFVGRNLGHLSRCVANLNRFQKMSNQKVKIYAFEHSHQWLRSNLPGCKVRNFSTQKIQKQKKLLLDSNLILHDWRKEVEILKKERGKKGPIIGGIYHSDLFVSGKDSYWTAKFKKEIHAISQKTTDVFFHMNLTPPKRIPKLSTLYLPVPIISREISMLPQNVKKKLGIPIDEPFILVHMGGGVGPYRYKFINEWYEKIKKLKTPYRIVVIRPFGEKKEKFPKGIIQTSLFENGRDLVHAAELVISKPGMGIMIDCISTGTPLLSLPADTKERKVKNMMLQDLVGCDVCVASSKFTAKDLSHCIYDILDQTPYIRQAFQSIPQNGAQVVAECMKLLSQHRIKELPDLYPQLRTMTPFGY